jgi:D,D-heptose 1,7-bisphosphate phosphatase
MDDTKSFSTKLKKNRLDRKRTQKQAVEQIAVIMAGGFGTRFAALTKEMAKAHPELFKDKSGQPVDDIPKPLAVISGLPVLEREIQTLVSQGFTEIIITVSHLAQTIIDYFGDGSGISPATGQSFGCHISYYNEETPLGNAGALWKIYDQLSDTFLLLNADSLFDIDFNRIVSYHIEHEALVTLFTHSNSHPYDSGVLITNEEHIVTDWLTKEDKRPEFYNNRVNAGLHVMSKEALERVQAISRIDVSRIGTEVNGQVYKVDLDRQVLKPLVKSTDGVIAYDSPEYVKDMGTPERFEAVCRDFESGVVHAKNLKNKQRAIFLDRDGTINIYKGFLQSIDDFELIPSITDVIKRINASGYLAIVITNQPVIARGEVSVPQLNLIHAKMETLLGQDGAYIDGLYYCPHHPDKGFEGEIPELKIDCNCRKPKIGLLTRAAEDFNIDLKSSWFIGDGKNDIQCGQNAGLAGTVLYTGPGSDTDHRPGEDCKPTYTVDDLNEAFNKIL